MAALFTKRKLFVVSGSTVLLWVVFAAAGSAQMAYAADASLYLSSPQGSFPIGSTFTVSVYVDTGGQAVNAVEADLTFPPRLLQVVSPSTGSSFIRTWIAQPSYDNANGTISFQGAVPNPGIKTSAGLISTVTFRVMGTGTALIKFSDKSKVLLNDGHGTDVLTQTTNGIYTLTVPPAAGPAVTSPTNPDQSQWYNTPATVFAWSTADPVDGFSYVLSDSPTDIPNTAPQGTSTSVAYNNLSDGIHYFHIHSLRAGVWGGTTHFAVRIDRSIPAAFTIQVDPSTYTSDQTPVISFASTDDVSGIDHYDLKVIPLDPPAAGAPAAAQTPNGGQNQPFFIEVSSPYLLHLPLGRYNIIVRAYDAAGNFYQAATDISIVSPLFQTLGSNGIRIGGQYVLGWPYAIAIAVVFIALLGYLLKKLWEVHRSLELRLENGPAGHPEIMAKLEELKQKKLEYDEMLKHLGVVLLLICGAGLLWAWALAPAGTGGFDFMVPQAHAATLTVSPPLVNLYPTMLGNDEILYLGGWANVPGGTVNITIERNDIGATYEGTATVGPDGNWFYSFPQLLDSGNYSAWATLTVGNMQSEPSARVNVTISPTAIKLGGARLNYTELYMLLFAICLVIIVVLVILIIISSRRVRAKRLRIEEAIRAAEESIRRGFLLLQRDIEVLLAGIDKMKLAGPLPEGERLREEKLRHDLEAVQRYIGKEVWGIEKEEER